VRVQNEVTVKAPTLQAAVRIVDKTNFLDPNYWLGLGDGPHCPHRLKARLITKKGLLDNANWVYHQANQLGKFDGDNNRHPTGLQIKALTDVKIALGGMLAYGNQVNRSTTMLGGTKTITPTCPRYFNILRKTSKRMSRLHNSSI